MLTQIGSLFREQRFKDALKEASLLECMAISICYVTSLHLQTPSKPVLEALKALVINANMNFIKVIELIIKRLPSESKKNHWARRLEEIVIQRTEQTPESEKYQIFSEIQSLNKLQREHVFLFC